MRLLIKIIIFILLFLPLTGVYALIPDDGPGWETEDWDENNPDGKNWGQELIKLPSAWDFTTGNQDIKIGIIDGGFYANHEDLKENIDITLSSIDLIREHGTHVVGIVGSRGNNGKGIAGTMWNTKLLLYGIENPDAPGTWTIFSAVLAMKHAVDNGAVVINYSGGRTYPNLLYTREANDLWKILIEWANRKRDNIVFVFSAGNDSKSHIYHSPSILSEEYDNVISVAAVVPTESLSAYSNYGEISVAAPGGDGWPFDEGDIFSTLPNNGYGYLGGTSMAAPFVSGLAGLIWSKANELGKTLTAAEVKDLIIQGAVKGNKFVSGPDNKQIPIINAYESLKLLVGPPVAVGAWPMFMHDDRHTGQSEYSGPSTANLQWIYTLVPEMTTGYIGTPIIGQDGTIYIGSGTMHEGYLYAINSDGSLKWKSQKLAAAPSASAISSNGTAYVYTGSYDFGRRIYALNPENGEEIWSFPVNNRVDYITIGPDQTIYFTSETGYLYALDSNTGNLKWDYDFGTFVIVRSAPAIGPDETIYVIKPGTTYINSVLYAFNSDGNLKWSRAYGKGNAGSASISQNGTIYVIAGRGLYAVNPQGDIIWYVSPGVEIETKTPAIVDNQTIIAAGYKKVWAFNSSDGSLRWSYDEPEDLFPTLYAVDKDGVVYLGFRTVDITAAKLVALNPDGSLKWNYSLKWLDSPPAISDGRLYVAGIDQDNNYNLYSFGE